MTTMDENIDMTRIVDYIDRNLTMLEDSLNTFKVNNPSGQVQVFTPEFTNHFVNEIENNFNLFKTFWTGKTDQLPPSWTNVLIKEFESKLQILKDCIKQKQILNEAAKEKVEEDVESSSSDNTSSADSSADSSENIPETSNYVVSVNDKIIGYVQNRQCAIDQLNFLYQEFLNNIKSGNFYTYESEFIGFGEDILNENERSLSISVYERYNFFLLTYDTLVYKIKAKPLELL